MNLEEIGQIAVAGVCFYLFMIIECRYQLRRDFLDADDLVELIIKVAIQYIIAFVAVIVLRWNSEFVNINERLCVYFLLPIHVLIIFELVFLLFK